MIHPGRTGWGKFLPAAKKDQRSDYPYEKRGVSFDVPVAALALGVSGRYRRDVRAEGTEHTPQTDAAQAITHTTAGADITQRQGMHGDCTGSGAATATL